MNGGMRIILEQTNGILLAVNHCVVAEMCGMKRDRHKWPKGAPNSICCICNEDINLNRRQFSWLSTHLGACRSYRNFIVTLTQLALFGILPVKKISFV